MIELIDLQKDYSNKTVLAVKQLEISSGCFVGLVGNNGAGKTTMLSLILDLIKSTSGKVLLKGNDVAKTENWKTYTGSYLGENFLIPFLTPVEYLSYIGTLHGKNKADLDLFLLEISGFFSNESMENKYIRDLSLGNKNKVGILAAIYTSPELLILDEPFANLDPGSQSWLKRKLTELNQNGVTVLMSSHDLKHVTDVCSRILLLDNGNIINDINVQKNVLVELESYFNVH
ncbi:ABC transporter ATP-binding protein [Natronoflexus pectinivorans]|uniref:ABC-2 type transport system ATP-binding protein n=1 Tax=Natronoflexus pectinivorans TaxID=682526 RepID=A0A4R2GIE5_9BACT|nr:ABC transporter ATP-binding protein [Natronoflexus pectinivorans]TCO08337.1 ABC-2 type transport system ATP-binding protein [Natronoflexus pectinivorans]